jgi:hypothetical protein
VGKGGSGLGGEGKGQGEGGEMTQALYAHMNKKKKRPDSLSFKNVL